MTALLFTSHPIPPGQHDMASSPRPKFDPPAAVDVDESGSSTTQTHSSHAIELEPTPEATAPQERPSVAQAHGHGHQQPCQPGVQKRLRLFLSSKLPAPVLCLSRRVAVWARGPQPPQPHRIQPIFQSLQTWPARLLARLPKPARFCVFVAAFVLWVVVFGVIIADFSLPDDVGGFGAPVRLSCASSLWPEAQSCGLDGRDCVPFDDASFAFICPADCSAVEVLNPYTIGDEQIIYRSLVVGGRTNGTEADGSVYRGDSFICGAAIHAGIAQDNNGGCGVLSLRGEQTGFDATSRNGIASVGFNSSFPMSFGFNRSEAVLSSSGECRDPRWNLLILSTILTSLFSLFASSAATFFAPIFIIIFFQIAMASDPPPYSDYPSLASTALGNFLPAAFIAVLIYRFSVRKTLSALNAHIEKTILWLGSCWVGALNNLTLGRIPIQRLTPHDLNQQPGAITALVIIVLVLVAIAIYQVWCFRREGRLLRYLALYAMLGVGLLILLGIPELSLRIHHYILALLLLPGTSLQTRPSLICQGLLVGLFINGIARWSFAPILETEAALRGDALLGRPVPEILAPLIDGTSITFIWEEVARGFEGISVLVNDVERFRGSLDNGVTNFTWDRQVTDYPEYFRFGYINYVPFGGVTYYDFTMAGTWWPNGSWTDIPPGLS